MIEILFGNTYILSFIIGLILATFIFKQSRRIKLNEPPLAYYQFPIIGHTWSYLTDCENLISESREKYGETFSLYVFGQVLTIVGKETTNEVVKKDQDFSFREGFIMQLPLNLIFRQDQIFEKIVKITNDYLAGKLKHLISRLQKNINKAIDLYIGECIEPKVIVPDKILPNIIAIPIANIIVGEECYNYEDILETFKNLTSSIIKLLWIPPILSFIHPWLHQQLITIPLKFGWNPISNHKKIIISRIKLVIEKRLCDKKRLGDAWVAPLDALQYFLDDPKITPDLDPNNVNYDYIANAISNLIFAAIGSTITNSKQALYNLVKRKQQYWQELYQEALEINKQCNGNELTFDDITRMVKLDSFVKESLRFSNSLVEFPHKCISKSYFTFANGYQIPRGRMVSLNLIETNNDEELQGKNPTDFNAYRHNSPATKLERNFLTFGGGKHACPGRFLAVNEIKIFLHEVILKYDVRTDTEIGLKRKYFGPFLVPLTDSLLFENRKEK